MTLASAASVALLAACAGAGGASSSSDGGGDAGTLEIWHAYAGQEDKVEFIDYALESFQEEHPDIKINEVPAEQSSYKTKLQTAMASGNAPDVFYTLPGGYLEAFVDSGQVMALDDELAEDGWGEGFIPSALPSVTFDDSTYAVPIDIDAALLWYDKALFDAHDWEVPTTWDDFLALCEQISAEGVIPVALGNKDSWPATFWFQYAEMRLHGSGVATGFGTDATFGPEGEQAAGVLQTLAEREFLPQGANGISDQEANILFLNGQAAMVLNGTWQIGMSAEAPDGFELGYFPFPSFPEGQGDQSDVLAGVAAAFAVAEEAENKEAAVAFLRHLTSPEVMTKYVEIRKTMVTLDGATTADAAGPVLAGIVEDVVGQAGTLDPFYDTAMAPTATETYYTSLQGIIDGSLSTADAAAGIEAAVQEGQ